MPIVSIAVVIGILLRVVLIVLSEALKLLVKGLYHLYRIVRSGGS